jgi:hypothetical protein
LSKLPTDVARHLILSQGIVNVEHFAAAPFQADGVSQDRMNGCDVGLAAKPEIA